MQFQVATGRRLPDGSIRVKTDINPANAPLTATLEGVVTTGEAGLSYAGTYSVSEVVTSTDESKPATSGWRSEGTFNLTRDRLAVDKAVLSQGPPDRPASLAGSLAITFGKSARFSADVAARQLDLDRSLGKGPSEPINVGTAAESLVDWLASLYVPPIPGRVTFNVPAIVVGGAVIQDVGFQASPQASGWQIGGFRARLPGQSTLEADGMLSTGAHIGFGGRVRLAVAQPATFASWWRGRSDRGAGRLLAPFDLSGRARIEPGRIALESMNATIGDTKLSGGFAWTAASGNAKRRLLETDISATRIDFVQIKALAELLVGTDLNDTAALADSYAIKLAADELAVEDILVHDISVDAGFVDGTLTVNALLIGDIGGARVSVTRGQVEDIFGSPRGQLVAHLNATTLSEFAGIIDRVDPGSAFSQWLTKAAPAIAPIAIDAKIEAPPADGSAAFRMTAARLGQCLHLRRPCRRRRHARPSGGRAAPTYPSSLSSYDALEPRPADGLGGQGHRGAGERAARHRRQGDSGAGARCEHQGQLRRDRPRRCGKAGPRRRCAAEVRRDLQGRFGQSRPDHQDDRPRDPRRRSGHCRLARRQGRGARALRRAAMGQGRRCRSRDRRPRHGRRGGERHAPLRRRSFGRCDRSRLADGT